MVFDGLGGKRHIEGILEGLSDTFQIDCYAVGARHLETKSNKFALSNSAFYRDVFRVMLLSNATPILFRKTLFGMYVVAMIKCLLWCVGKKCTVFFEFNGISGDFRLKAALPRRLAIMTNIPPLLIANGVYAVNQNIAQRLSKWAQITKTDLAVGVNGCFKPSLIRADCPREELSEFAGLLSHGSNQKDLVFFFYGSNQPKYHLREFILSLEELKSQLSCVVYMVGHDFESFEYFSTVKNLGPMAPVDFENLVASLEHSNKWGLIPLDLLPAGSDVIPIKAMDYITAGLRIFHSSACLTGDELVEISESYQIGDERSLKAKLLKIKSLSYSEPDQSELQRLCDHHSWSKTLDSVKEMLLKHQLIR